MSFKPYYFILFLIFISSSISVGFLLLYMNPETDPKLAFSLMGATLGLSISSFLAGFFFFIKKIHYRGEISLSTMHASIRQGILVTCGIFMMICLYAFHIFEPKLVLISWASIACLEVMIQAIE